MTNQTKCESARISIDQEVFQHPQTFGYQIWIISVLKWWDVDASIPSFLEYSSEGDTLVWTIKFQPFNDWDLGVGISWLFVWYSVFKHSKRWGPNFLR